MKNDQKYDTIPDLEDAGDSDGTPDHWQEIETEPRKTRALRACSWITDICLLVVIVGLLVERSFRPGYNYQFEGSGDITGFAPKFSQQIKRFRPDKRFAPHDTSKFWNSETQDAWLSLVPPALGYVNVTSPEKYKNLPHPVHDYPNQTVFTTSMTHQLHCLYVILEAYSALTSNANVQFSPKWHTIHCFEYLRQSIMCAGDVALEGAETTFPGDEGGSDGWDARHVCKNYEEIYEYLDKNRANDDKWIR